MAKRSERSRWVRLLAFSTAGGSTQEWHEARLKHMRNVVEAFGKIGRVVRIEVDGYSLVLKARK